MPEINLLNLKQWFLENKRDFPWRKKISPYGVWVSEVMLQQTRADVVIPYFLKWMRRYPDIKSLADSSTEEVIKYWEGLGYYSRARNLHTGAKQILQIFQGKLPDDPKELVKIKGLGPYTVNAILSFAFQKKAFPLDGNVIRVLTRFFAKKDDVSKQLTVNNLRKLGNNLLPNDQPWIISEALIELGATVCTKKPLCRECPINANCKAYLSGNPEAFPFKSKKTAITSLKRAVGVFLYQRKILITKEHEGKLMAGLHEFPYFEIEEPISIEEFKYKAEEFYPLKIASILPLKKQNHTFTRYRAELFPFLCHVIPHSDLEGYDWLSSAHLKEAAFSSGHRRILSTVEHLIL